MAAVAACAAAKKLPPPGWTEVDMSVDSVFSPTTRDLGNSTYNFCFCFAMTSF